METDEPDTGAKQDPVESNVVRFPRDWLGPLDELVPFGPSAGQVPDHSTFPNRQSPAPTGDEVRPPSPLRPQDFWGEDAAAIHDALEGDAHVPRDAAPAARVPTPAPAAGDPPLGRGRAGWGGSRRRRAHGDGAARRLVLSVPRRIGYRIPRSDKNEPARGKWWTSVPAATIAVALGAIGLLIASLGGRPAKHLVRQATADAPRAVAFAAATAFIPLERHRQPSVVPVVHARPRPHARVTPPPQPASRGTFVRATSVSAPPQSTSSAAAATAQSSRPTTSVIYSPPQRVVTPARTTPPATESAQAPASRGSGRTAFGPNGLLGPGTSPNS